MRWIAWCLTIMAASCSGSQYEADQEPLSLDTAFLEESFARGITGNAARPGDVLPEPATLHSLAVRWPVVGDANANASIAVDYREEGVGAWRAGYPLFRTLPSRVSEENVVPGGWLFAGSIVDLVPGTEYEVRLRLADPDGGGRTETLTMRTLAEPRQPPDMRIRHVIADERGGGSGAEDDPFRGLKAAQNAAEPGDLFLLHAGVYRVGEWVIDRHGRAGRPIIYRGAGDGQTILDGGGAQQLIAADGIRHVWFEDLTLRNARYLIVGHNGGDTVIRRSRFEVVEVGIAAINGGYEQSRGFIITDNMFHGPASWPRSRGIEEFHAVSITGAGHVIAYNLITNMADGVHGTQYGGLSASDIHNNDIYVCTDDGIEADYADTNVRVFRNRITNCFAGISGQPINGGPLYVFRNAIYNVEYSPFKLHNHTSGILLFHNTSVAAGVAFDIRPGGETVSNVATRNNLFIGAAGYALHSTGQMIACDFDSDGYGGYNGWFGGPFADWNGETYESPEDAQRSGRLYGRYGAIVVDPDEAFKNGFERPDFVETAYDARLHPPRLEADSAAVDSGVTLPNFNDGFAGRAPDLGCCERGEPIPHYGPRPEPMT